MKKLVAVVLSIVIMTSLAVPVLSFNRSTSDYLTDNPRTSIYRTVVEDFYSKPQTQWTSGNSENNYGSHGLIALMGISITSGKKALSITTSPVSELNGS